MAQIEKTDILVLRSIRWHESSKIVYVFSRAWGRCGLIAKGALRPKSPFAGNLEALNYLEAEVSVKSGRELQILTAVSVHNNFSLLRLDLDRLPYALAVLEVLDQVMEGQASDHVFFDFIVEMLKQIEQAPDPQVVFGYFLIKLSSYLGFRPQLSACQNCGSEQISNGSRFDFYRGALYCPDCAYNSSAGMKLSKTDVLFLQRLQKHPHKAIKELAPPPDLSKHWVTFLIQYLSVHLEKTISLNALQLLIST